MSQNYLIKIIMSHNFYYGKKKKNLSADISISDAVYK